MDGIMIEIIFDDVQDAYLMWLYYITAFLIIVSDFQNSGPNITQYQRIKDGLVYKYSVSHDTMQSLLALVLGKK